MAASPKPVDLDPPPRRPRTSTTPLTGLVGGALSGFATTGNPLGACIGRAAGILGNGFAQARYSEMQP